MGTKIWLAVSMALALIVGLVGVSATPGTAATPDSDQGLIAFESHAVPGYGEDSGIHIMSGDGTGMRFVTPSGVRPALSPDASQIAFQTTHKPWQFPEGLWVVDIDGGNRREVVPDAIGRPAWTADGTRLAFTTTDRNPIGIWTIDPDGTDAAPLVVGGPNPAFSPDGTKVAFSMAMTGIWVADADGGDAIRLTDHGDLPTWSPDSLQIAYADHPAIRVMNADGSENRVLVTGTNNGEPAWSPDGTRMAFYSSRNLDSYGGYGVLDLFTIRLDGSGLTNITNSPARIDSSPSWPATRRVVATAEADDGCWLAYRDGTVEAHGGAEHHGDAKDRTAGSPVVGLAATPTGEGYWLAVGDGSVFAFGDAGSFGSESHITLNQPIVGMAATPTGQGYRLVASDGGIFTLGDVVFCGPGDS